ncbi:MAG: adenosylmethionine decarboxylase [Candidatus Marsarchaeota archaeon]|nr:adenosylmethionine decarboxylase [Candidatus Marsarchaeota archaeon]
MSILTKKRDVAPFKEQVKIRGNEENLKAVEQIKVIEDDSLVGKHVFGDLYSVDKNAIADSDYLQLIMKEGIAMTNVRIIEMKQASIGGRKGGVSIMVLMDSGHAVLHIWYSDNYATLDIFTFGGRTEPVKAFDYVVGKLRPRRHKMFSVDRSQVSV